jgi:hypothetical protein
MSLSKQLYTYLFKNASSSSEMTSSSISTKKTHARDHPNPALRRHRGLAPGRDQKAVLATRRCPQCHVRLRPACWADRVRDNELQSTTLTPHPADVDWGGMHKADGDVRGVPLTTSRGNLSPGNVEHVCTLYIIYAACRGGDRAAICEIKYD